MTFFDYPSPHSDFTAPEMVEVPEGVTRAEAESFLSALAQIRHTARWVKSATTPQTAGGASTRDQAISQAPPTREGPRGRPRPPVDVPAPPLPTTKETT